MTPLPANSNNYAANLDSIRDAARRIRNTVIRTPVITCESIDRSLNTTIHFKCENLQRAGAFKSRGACNAIFALDDETASRGVVAHSSGNHAAAVARAASIRGIPAHIVMPHDSRAIKIANVRSFGIEPVFCEPDSASREATAQQLVDDTGAALLHPFNDSQVIAGQGTVALELMEQVPDLDAIVIPVGGGGLLSGTLLTVKSLKPEIKVIAAEPAWADDVYRSLSSGQIEQPERYDTIADGLRTCLGSLTFPIIRELVNDVLLVDESTIVSATTSMLNEAKLVVEPSAAVPLGCIMQHPELFRDLQVGVVLSGGNVDLSHWNTSI